MLPRGAMILLTNRCGLQCKHCGIINSDNYCQTDLRYEKVKLILEDFSKNKVCIVAYSGGDPLLYPNLLDVLNLTRRLGMLAVLGITGTDLTEEMVSKISKTKIGCVQVSIDGNCKETHDAIRGKGTFEDVLRGITLLQKYNILVNVAICICKENYYEFEMLLNMLYKMRIYKVKVQIWEEVEGCHQIHGLSKYEKKMIFDTCKSFEQKYRLKQWIQFENSELKKIYKHSIVVNWDGDVMDTSGKVYGNVEESVPSIMWERNTNL